MLPINLSPNEVLHVILVGITLSYLWELYLNIRQYKVTKTTVNMPRELQSVMSQETFDKARLYSMDKNKFSMLKETINVGITLFITYFGLLAKFYMFVDRFEGEVATSVVWQFSLMAIQTVIELPLTVYYTFVLEERYGFNKQTAKFFALDQVKSFILANVITVPLSCIMIMIVRYGGHFFFLWLWLAVGVITLLLMTIYPSYIAPYFDKYTPLPEGELKTQIEQLAASLNFPLTKLYIVEGSKRSSHSNAYFYGFFKNKRIVLFDTLLDEQKGCSNEEILAILTHELGHWNHNHVLKHVIIFQVNLFIMFMFFSMTFQCSLIYEAFGFPPNIQPVLCGLLFVIQFVMMPYNTVLSAVLISLSRRFEFQADRFACKLKKAAKLEASLIKLNKENLGFPVYDKLYSMWNHSHPPLLSRIEEIRKCKED